MSASTLAPAAATFEEHARQSLIKSHIRLGQFIAAGNGTMIAAELELMLRRAICAYGAQVMEVHAHQVMRDERAANGWCVACEGTPNKVTSKDGVMEAYPMCGKCLSALSAAAARHGINDDNANDNDGTDDGTDDDAEADA